MKSYNLFIFILCIPLLSFTTDTKKHEKSKTINKTYTVNKNATVYINNKYGNVSVTTWNENRVEIDVKITVKGNNLDKVEDKLQSITVKFEATKDLVEARTMVENTKSSWSWWGNDSNLNYEINYSVKMPKTNNADLHNKYGNIELDELEGKANIECDYGNIEVEKLLNETNSIELDYCGGSDVKYMKSGTLNADYSKITIDETENLKANIDYTTLKVGKVNNLSFSSDYGSLTVDEVTHVSGSSDYAGMRFGTVYKNLKIDTDYGGLRINNLAKGFENVTIDGSYAGIKIGTASNNNFKFNIDLGYAGFGYPEEKVEMFKSVKKTSKKYYEGLFGKGNSNSILHIKSNYGGVSLKLND
ncbi:hypothetical protein C7447_10293 [Tenacibaculum adriaticum]|uniref:Adhesin n=2 Tax=Tenacibaculum adriaticum TaxID=413713 RepID=A0A5S5DTT4_9FLAO|nr:hypothetical protein C7447_10293 [Tenacibaculum adriaticum]